MALGGIITIFLVYFLFSDPSLSEPVYRRFCRHPRKFHALEYFLSQKCFCFKIVSHQHTSQPDHFHHWGCFWLFRGLRDDRPQYATLDAQYVNHLFRVSSQFRRRSSGFCFHRHFRTHRLYHRHLQRHLLHRNGRQPGLSPGTV